MYKRAWGDKTLSMFWSRASAGPEWQSSCERISIQSVERRTTGFYAYKKSDSHLRRRCHLIHAGFAKNNLVILHGSDACERVDGNTQWFECLATAFEDFL